jgi:2',3'-cyclic-nucleotide 2'-phosphodiesterase (5'-nucleotidase family)
LAAAVKDLGIPFMGGGHCHNPYSNKVDNTVIVTSGSNFSGYGYARIEYTPSTDETTILDFGIHKNEGGPADSTIETIINRWQDESDAELNKEIGYLENEIPQRSQAMQDLISESWLLGYPTADISLTNLGGMRDRIPAGPVTIADIVSVMPFNNVLMDLKMTGQQVLLIIRAGESSLAIGGLHKESGAWIMNKTSEKLIPDETYTVLVTDFLYAGGDQFGMFARFDPNAYNTAIDWRQPVIDWLLSQASTPETPLDSAIKSLTK